MELPRSLPIDDTSAIDVALVEDPFLGPNFLTVCANGEFVSLKKPTVPPQPGHSLHPGIICSGLEKMVTIAISDYVINSAAKVYFEVCSSLFGVDNVLSLWLSVSPFPWASWVWSVLSLALPIFSLSYWYMFLFYSACPTAFNFVFSSHCYSPQSPSCWSYPQSYQTVLGHTTPLKACECNIANVLFPPTLFFSPLILISAVLAFSGRGIGLVGGRVTSRVNIKHRLLEMDYTTAVQKISKWWHGASLVCLCCTSSWGYERWSKGIGSCWCDSSCQDWQWFSACSLLIHGGYPVHCIGLISCSQRYIQWYLVNHCGIKVYYLGCSMWCSWSSILVSNAAGYACCTKKRVLIE